ncbi:uncharacterized protein LOC130736055 [Lotus japonicus]|uniref:uncharacterized protein LOC130736055 n=1 Tax=Lotus japonicus TaxID=34305 RepID=UPI002588C7F3|nr:uncharacterized protein LOC130736055 [Lotus japonicus]
MIKLLASYNKEVDDVVLENARQNAKYTSPTIQKEIVHVFARNVQSDIRKEIGDAKFCLLVDEARDESKREQMALVIRFVDKNGYVKKHFLDIIHIALVASAKEVVDAHAFFQNLNMIVNVVGSSCKRNDELHATYANEILRYCGLDALLEDVRSFCDSRSIEVPDMSSSFSYIIRSRRQKDKVTIEHHYRIDVFNAVIDQLKELNTRFSEQATELLKLSTTLDPKNSFKSFNVGHIYNLVEKFYPSDFSGQEKIQLAYELQHYEFDVIKDVKFQNLSTIGELCQKLVETEKSNVYPLLDRLL